MTVFLPTIKNKKLDFGSDYGEARWRDFLNTNEGKKLRIEKSRNPVSDELRGYYWSAVLPTAKSAIHEWEKLNDDDVHEILKKLFNYFDFHNPLTKRIERCGRPAMSSDSNSSRAMDFIDKIREWLANEYKIELPTPDEYKIKRDNPEFYENSSVTTS